MNLSMGQSISSAAVKGMPSARSFFSSRVSRIRVSVDDEEAAAEDDKEDATEGAGLPTELLAPVKYSGDKYHELDVMPDGDP